MDLLPVDASGEPSLVALTDLFWIAGTLHPTGHRVFRPTATSADDPAGVKAIAPEHLARTDARPSFARAVAHERMIVARDAMAMPPGIVI